MICRLHIDQRAIIQNPSLWFRYEGVNLDFLFIGPESKILPKLNTGFCRLSLSKILQITLEYAKLSQLYCELAEILN